MSQKVALVTGSATGIGRACAIRFAREGLAVAINYSKSEKEANETLTEVKKFGVPALLCKADVADESSVKDMIACVTQEFGGLDVLVNNAGKTHFIDHTNLDALADNVWQDIFQVNLLGTFYCCRAAMPFLQERGGSIVNVTSVAGISGLGSSIPYAASKAAANSLTRSLARAFAPKVRVNAVASGPVETRWLADHQDHIDNYVKLVPMQRAAKPEDIADTVFYLALGTSLTTGQVVIVDGGRTI